MLQVWGSYIWRGLYVEGLIFGILRYLYCDIIIFSLLLSKLFCDRNVKG